ncbi:MAG TPA: hypothetical protein QKA14_00205 [Candidatus Megaira endosymbiont of Hartmannula sinica]|nr:hypothetical protein [Candidatus Megaera endosymbiont of Hartmannula sinica]
MFYIKKNQKYIDINMSDMSVYHKNKISIRMFTLLRYILLFLFMAIYGSYNNNYIFAISNKNISENKLVDSGIFSSFFNKVNKDENQDQQDSKSHNSIKSKQDSEVVKNDVDKKKRLKIKMIAITLNSFKRFLAILKKTILKLLIIRI